MHATHNTNGVIIKTSCYIRCMNFITAFHWRHDMSKLSIMTLQDDEM